MILFLRSSNIGIDSKLRRYCRALRLSSIGNAALFWDRDSKTVGDINIPAIKYSSPQKYSSRLYIGLKILGLNGFALRKMFGLRHSISLVHAIDLDTAVAAWMFNRVTGTPYILSLIHI